MGNAVNLIAQYLEKYSSISFITTVLRLCLDILGLK